MKSDLELSNVANVEFAKFESQIQVIKMFVFIMNFLSIFFSYEISNLTKSILKYFFTIYVVFSGELLYTRSGSINKYSNNNNGATWKMNLDESKGGWNAGGGLLLSKGQIMKRTAAAAAAIVRAAKAQQQKTNIDAPSASIANLNGSCAAVFELRPKAVVELAISFSAPRWMPPSVLLASKRVIDLNPKHDSVLVLHADVDQNLAGNVARSGRNSQKCKIGNHNSRDKPKCTMTLNLSALVGFPQSPKETLSLENKPRNIVDKYENVVAELGVQNPEKHEKRVVDPQSRTHGITNQEVSGIPDIDERA